MKQIWRWRTLTDITMTWVGFSCLFTWWVGDLSWFCWFWWHCSTSVTLFTIVVISNRRKIIIIFILWHDSVFILMIFLPRNYFSFWSPIHNCCTTILILLVIILTWSLKGYSIIMDIHCGRYIGRQQIRRIFDISITQELRLLLLVLRGPTHTLGRRRPSPRWPIILGHCFCLQKYSDFVLAVKYFWSKCSGLSAKFWNSV